MIEANVYIWLQSLGLASVRPLLLREGDALPALVYTPVAARKPLGVDGSAQAEFAQIQVDVWAETYKAAKTLAAAVDSINGFAGDFFGQTVGLIESSKNFDDFDEGARRFRVSLDISIYF